MIQGQHTLQLGRHDVQSAAGAGPIGSVAADDTVSDPVHDTMHAVLVLADLHADLPAVPIETERHPHDAVEPLHPPLPEAEGGERLERERTPWTDVQRRCHGRDAAPGVRRKPTST